ncbi:MAG: tail fiber domain-containing protein [Candidatus Pacebacteria bacterium]|nr:tail fiber domain-containing protein [Candidatus Paceibacterota bacterium]
MSRFLIVILAVFLIAIPAHAALYTPGATLDPACLPTDTGCGVATTTYSNGVAYSNGTVTNTGLLSLTPQYGSTLTGALTIASSTTGSDFSITSSGSTITFNLPTASASSRGLLSAADWTTFNNKQDALTFMYPLVNADNTVSLAFGTTTANTWSGLQVFSGNASSTQLTTSGNTYLATLGGSVIIGTTTPVATLTVAGNGYLSGALVIGSALTVGDATTTRNNLGLTYAASNQASWYNITAWGDSLTAGKEDGTTVSYPNQLQADLPGTVVTTEGVGGNTSTQIGIRQGGVTTTATISGGQIPASGGVTVTFPTGYEPVTTSGPSTGVSGTIAGVYGTVTLSASVYTFTRATAGTAVTVSSAPFIVNTGSLNNGTVIIWAGRNNLQYPTQVESDIAAMVASLPSPKRYLIMSVLNGEGEGPGTLAYSDIMSINASLAATYPNNYIDVRTYLVSQYNPSLSQDVTDYASDTPPNSLRFDAIHLNAAGYTLVAQQVANWLTAYNASNPSVVSYQSLSTLLASPTLGVTVIASSTNTGPLLTVASTTSPTSPPFTVLANGNVGVGLVTPLAKLHVYSASTTAAFQGNTFLGEVLDSAGYSGTYTGLDFANSDGGGHIYPKARIAMTNSSSGSFLSFGTTGNWNSGITNTALTINPNGYVGVGTTTPTTPFYVYTTTSNSTFTGANHLEATIAGNYIAHYTGLDFINGSSLGQPSARIAMSNDGTGSYLYMGTTNAFASGITNTALTINPIGNLGIGTTTPYSRLTLWGPDTAAGTAAFTISNSASSTEFQVFDNGAATLAGTLTQNSDQRLKTNVQSLDASSSLAAIMALNPVAYTWIDPSQGTGTQMGFIAQAVQQIFPQLVSTTSATALTPGGTLGLNYIGLIAPIVESIKELGGEVQGLAVSITTDLINAHTVKTQTLCVGSTCVTESQLKAILQATGQSGSPAPSAPDTSTTTSTSDSTTTDATSSSTADSGTTTPSAAGSQSTPPTDTTSDSSSSSDSTTPPNSTAPAADNSGDTQSAPPASTDTPSSSSTADSSSSS